MATIKSPCLFFTTSPRTPEKMKPEIRLLTDEFGGLKWEGNVKLQADYMRKLAQMPEFEGRMNQNDPALSARDRITRGPKALGLVDLGKIAITPAGEQFLDADLSEESLLRQMMKFQLPSPYHKVSPSVHATFCVKPYLEILRLIDKVGSLSFDELQLFGMQLTDYHSFDDIVSKVLDFRKTKNANKGKYKLLFGKIREDVVKNIFRWEIKHGKVRTRESKEQNLLHFIETKGNNLRDYADACLRYFRATGLVTITNPGRTISIIESRKEDVAFLLSTVPRDPVFIFDMEHYQKYLFDATLPKLYSDDRNNLEAAAGKYQPELSMLDLRKMSTTILKKKIKNVQEISKRKILENQISKLKSYSAYDDVMEVFDGIKSKSVYDAPLALEWNIWRAMTMIDGGDIKANLSFDSAGNPMLTAPGNNADIVCDYGSFSIAVEVTMMAGQKQYEAEGEPIARHLGNLKKETGKPAYCLFIAPKIIAPAMNYCESAA